MATHGTLRRDGIGLSDRIEFRSQRPPVGCIGRQLLITNTSARFRAGVMPASAKNVVIDSSSGEFHEWHLDVDNLFRGKA